MCLVLNSDKGHGHTTSGSLLKLWACFVAENVLVGQVKSWASLGFLHFDWVFRVIQDEDPSSFC